MGKNVVLAVFTLQGGGAERVVLTLAKALVESGNRATVVIFKDHIDYDVPSGVDLVLFPYERFRVLPRALRFSWAARSFDKFISRHCGVPDLVLSNLVPVDRVLSNSHLPHVYHVLHSPLSDEIRHVLKNETNATLKRIYRFKPVIAVSKAVEKDYRQFIDQPLDSITIFNPILPKEIERLSTQPIEIDRPYIVHVGSFKKAKRHDLLLKAYSKTEKTHKLLLLGQGKLREEAERQVEKLNLSNDVIFLGFKANPYPYIKNAKLLVLSSEIEGLGMVLIEALQLGTPAISFDCDHGPREILPPTSLVPFGDTAGLARKIDEILTAPLPVKLSVPKHFLPDHVVKQYLALGRS